MNTFDVYIYRTEKTKVRVKGKNYWDAINIADEYVTFPDNTEDIIWDMDYDYDFKVVYVLEEEQKQ
jgi:hypothetical protein